MMEDECGASTMYLNFKYEKYYARLVRYYKPITFPCYPKLKMKELNFDDYYTITRNALLDMDESTPMKMIITIYLVTRHLIAEWKEMDFYFCNWMNRLLDENDVNWNCIVVQTETVCKIL